MNIEIGHIYIQDLEQIEEILLPSINEYKENSYEEHNKVLLIDNKNDLLTICEKQKIIRLINVIFEKHGIFDIDFFFEKDFENNADKLIESITKDKIKAETFRKSKKRVFFYISENEKIPLYEEKEGKRKYYCQLLSLSWSLYKLGKYGDNNILILPKIYEKVESQVNFMQKDMFGVENSYNFH